MENSWRRILSVESRLSASSTDESGYDGDSSGERSPWLFQATTKILTELEKLATSQRRIEGMLVNLARTSEEHREHLKMLRNLEFDCSNVQGPVELPTLPGVPKAKSEVPAVLDPTGDLGRADTLGLDLGPMTVGPRVSREDNMEREAMFARSPNPEDNRADHRKQTFKVISPLRSSFAQRKSVEFEGAKKTSHGITSMCGNDFVSLHLPSSWPNLPLRVALARGARLNELELHATTMARFPGDAEQLVGGRDSSRSGTLDLGRSWFVLAPSTTSHMLYDLFSLIVLVTDLTCTPVMLAWNLDALGFLLGFLWFTPTFWSIDMLMNLFTGFHRDGVLEMNFFKVGRHYLRTWFLLDLCIVLCDWFSVFIEVSGASSRETDTFRLLKVLKLSRLLKIVSLLKLFRLWRLLEDMFDRSFSEGSRLLISVMSMFIFILWINHVICCGWFFLGRAGPTDTNDRWLDSIESSFLFEYVTAFHWSMAQLTLGAIEVNPSNSIERIFTIILLLVGLFFSASLVGSLSAAMIEYQQKWQVSRQMQRNVRHYLRQNSVGQAVAIRVRQQVEKRLHHKAGEEKLSFYEVEGLSLVSASLQAELRFDIFERHLTHPLFQLWTSLSTPTVEQLCVKAVDFVFLQAKDDLFVAGQRGNRAYNVIRGELRYEQNPETSAVTRRVARDVGEKTWICEAALWTEWIHVGTTVAETAGQLLTISADGVAQCMEMHALIHALTVEYGKCFHRCVATSKPPAAKWPTDIEVPFTEFGAIVHTLGREYQLVIGLNALEKHSAKSRDVFALTPLSMSNMHVGKKGPRRTLVPSLMRKESGRNSNGDVLRDEVLSSRSIMLLNASGEVERLVSVVTFEVTRDDGRMFVQLGKVGQGRIKPLCERPAAKLETGEMALDALNRILSTKLSLLAGIEVTHMSQTDSTKPSESKQVVTKYLKTVCHANLRSSVQALRCRVDEASLSGGGFFNFSRIVPEDIYVVQQQGTDKVKFFGWLTRHEFEGLQDHRGDAAISVWLSSLRTTDADGTSRVLGDDPTPMKLVLYT